MAFLETLLAEAGLFPYLPWHQRRLERTLRRHEINRSYDLAASLRAPTSGRWRCRVVYDADKMQAECLPYIPRRIRTLTAVEDESIRYGDKTTDRAAIDALFALRGGADDVLIVQQGLITDTSIANVACLIDGRWLTPRVPLLQGTARARLLSEGKLAEADITLEAARLAERIAVMNALSGFVEVSGGILPEMIHRAP